MDAPYIPNPKSNPQNLKKTPVSSEIRGFDLAKRSIKNYLPLRGVDIRIRSFLQRGGYPQRVEPKWSRLQSIGVLSSPFESVCVYRSRLLALRGVDRSIKKPDQSSNPTRPLLKFQRRIILARLVVSGEKTQNICQ